MQNPFRITFGKEPVNYIRREQQREEIIENFSDKEPPYQVCMITGVRGSGKTVMLTDISKYFRNEKDWIVVELSPEEDLIHTLASKLSNIPELLEIIKDAKINLSFLGLGLEIDGVPPITDISVALERMLEKLGRKQKRLLIVIDEIICNKEVKRFASLFQIYLRMDYPVFLIMTGLYENIYELQNQKTLTFLYRTPKMELRPLNIGMIADKYTHIFKIPDDEALRMAKETNGYPFAFQVLGYLSWNNAGDWRKVIPEYCSYLEEYVYEKMWSEMSDQDRKVLMAMTKVTDLKVENIRKQMGKSSNEFSVYRNRLIKKGVINSPQYGCLEFSLPKFKEFIVKIY